MRKVITLLFMGLLTIGSARAGVSVNALGGVTSGSPSVTGNPTSTYKSGTALTYGATLDLGLLPMFAIETGILSVGKKFTQTSGGVDAIVTTRATEIPVLLRFTALPVLDLGAGVYYQSYKNTYDAEALGIKTTGNSWAGAGLKNHDLGLKFSARLMFPIVPMAKFVIDGAYKMGLSNLYINPGSASWKNKEIDALAGIALGF